MPSVTRKSRQGHKTSDKPKAKKGYRIILEIKNFKFQIHVLFPFFTLRNSTTTHTYVDFMIFESFKCDLTS